ncbi:ABC transporter substrate-binding protein [Fodinicurvata sp. EGI_FJ10296]|uniref:ABC transporter substrate-binding protein n=1 Tax=Fodinicurvata sp. EGI_FJ10296 TaxID=3231908 RepID=UPI003456A746
MNRSSLMTGAAAIAFGVGAAFAAPAFADTSDTIVIDLVNEPSTLDPHQQWNPDSYYVYRNIFDNMVTRDNAGEIVPQVATDWEYAAEDEVVFTIRDDIVFHDGEPLTADDVAYSVNRIIDPEFASPQLGQFNQITGAEVTGENEVTLTTDGPYPVLLPQLVKLSIVPEHYVEEVGNDAFNAEPIGSGPYVFDEWERGIQVSLIVNEDYWGDSGEFARAEFRAVPEASTRMANLQSGESDLIVTIDPDMAMQLENSAGVQVLNVLTERVAFLRLNAQRGPTADPLIRQAIAHAIDKELIVEGLLGGFDEPVDVMLSPAHFGFIEGIEGPGYDPDRARELMAEAGDIATEPMVFATSPVFDQRIVQALQQMLSEVGFNAEIELTDMSTYLSRVQSEAEEAPHMNFGRWSCACQDADGVLYPLLHSSSAWSTWRSEETDASLEAARSSLDEDVRLENYADVHETVVEDVPLVPLYQAAILYGAAENLEWQPTPNESMFLNRMSWSE